MMINFDAYLDKHVLVKLNDGRLLHGLLNIKDDGFYLGKSIIETEDIANISLYDQAFSIRPITEKDDAAMAFIVRESLASYGLDIPGTAYFDPELDHLSNYYHQGQRRAYYVLIYEDKLIGGVGYQSFEALKDCAELQKLYVALPFQGLGLGRYLLNFIEGKIFADAYRQIYLETHSSLYKAISLYYKNGYEDFKLPFDANHGAMDTFLIKKLRDK